MSLRRPEQPEHFLGGSTGRPVARIAGRRITVGLLVRVRSGLHRAQLGTRNGEEDAVRRQIDAFRKRSVEDRVEPPGAAVLVEQSRRHLQALKMADSDGSVPRTPDALIGGSALQPIRSVDVIRAPLLGLRRP